MYVQKRYIVLPYSNHKEDAYAERLTKLFNETFNQVELKVAFKAPNEKGNSILRFYDYTILRFYFYKNRLDFTILRFYKIESLSILRFYDFRKKIFYKIIKLSFLLKNKILKSYNKTIKAQFTNYLK